MARKVRIGICIAPSCAGREQVLYTKDLCHRHYQRRKRHGTIDDIDRRVRQVADGNKYCAKCDRELPREDFREKANYCRSCETEYYRARKAAKDERGECYSCGRKALTGKKMCASCRKRDGEYRSSFSVRANHLLSSAKRRSRLQGVKCTLDIDWVMSRIVERCELTGIPFDLEVYQKHGQRFNPYSPSIDRIKARGDYSPENSRMVVTAVNVAMNGWGEEIFKTVARAYVRKQREQRRYDQVPRTYDLPLDGQPAGSVRIRKH